MIDKFKKEKISVKEILSTFKTIPKIINLTMELDKKSCFIMMLLTLCGAICPTLILLANQELLNNLVTKDSNVIFVALAVFVGIKLFYSTIMNITEYYQQKFQSIIKYGINCKVMKKCTELSLEHFENSEVYDKLQRVQNEVSHKPFEVFMLILQLLSSFVSIGSALMIIIAWKPWVCGILLIVPIYFSYNFFEIGRLEFKINWARAPLMRKSWYISHIMTKDFSFKEIKLFDLGNHLLDRYKKINKDFIKENFKLYKKRGILSYSFEFMEEMCLTVITVIIIFSVIAGEIMIGNVVALINTMKLINSTNKSLLNVIYKLYQNSLYMNQLFEFLEISVEDGPRVRLHNDKIQKIDNIKVKNLKFKYPTGKENALKGIDFEISKGERVAIVGRNGSGKSTLMKLLLRMYNTEDESIFFNNVPIKNIHESDVRKEITALFQDFVKYELSVRENIAFGNIEELNNDKKIRAAMEMGKIDFIDDIDSQLGLWFEDGKQLSGGQWQKIAIARAFFRDASLCILDEPSSALDPISEKEIIKMFMEITKGKIGIFISHRLSTAMLADKIIVMDKGRITGIGTHKELLLTNEIYKTMYRLESLDQEYLQKVIS